MSSDSQGGFIRRTWHRLRSPSARWSVLALVVVGALIGFAATVGTAEKKSFASAIVISRTSAIDLPL